MTVLLVAMAVLAAACSAGGSSYTGQGPTAESAPVRPVGGVTAAPVASSPLGGFPVTVQAANGQVTLASQPRRIVSLSASATETLWAVGAGPQVVAVDDGSDFPAGVPATTLSAYQPDVDAIVAYEPDLVVLADDVDDVAAALGRKGIAVLVQPAPLDLAQAYGYVSQLGVVTGHAAEGAAAATSLQLGLEAAAATLPVRPTPLTYLHELDDSGYTITSETFLGQLYGLAGLASVADAFDDGTGLPRVPAELVAQEDPDLIILADTVCCGQSAATVAARPGWAQLTAVTQGRVVAVDDDVAARWGPRLVELMEAVVRAAATVPVG